MTKPHKLRAACCRLSAALISAQLAFSAVSPPAVCAQSKPDNQEAAQVVAEVGRVRISKAELDAQLRGHLQKELLHFDAGERHTLAKKMLESMIDRQLLLQAAARHDLIPSNKAVGDFVDKIKRSLPERGRFTAELEKHGLSEESFSHTLKDDLAIKEYLDRFVFRDLSVSEKEISDFYNANQQRYTAPREAKVRHILLKVDKDAKDEEVAEVKSQAESILQQARADASDFAALARKHSQAETKNKGGLVGFFTANQMPEAFSKAAFALEPGGISDLVRTSHGFHIIRAEEFRGGKLPPLADVEDLVKNDVLRGKREELLKDHLQQLRRHTKVIVYFQ